MKVCAVIAEYNPFHNGHKAMLDQIRAENPDCAITVILGSHFTQRGDVAVITKSARAEAALRCGADIVIGMPVTCSLASAEKFALGGVSIMQRTNVVDEIYFGSECGNTKLLLDAKRSLNDARVEQHIKLNLNSGKTYAKIREEAVNRFYGDKLSDIIKEPNNILGIEYLKALETLQSDIIPKTIKRIAVAHDGGTSGEFASASYIREHINEAMYFVPYEMQEILEREYLAGHCPARLNEIGKAILAMLRTITPERIKSLPDLSEGIENRLIDSILSAKSLDELFESAKTKRYTMARIKRLFLYAALGITKDDADTLPQYLHILGATERGISLLSEISEKAKLPLVTKYSDFANLRGKAKRQLEIECDAANLYSLCFPSAYPCGTEITYKFIKI